jgi:acyl carrier protein
MQVEAMIDQIKKFLVEHFPTARHIGNDDQLLGNGLLDSLGVLDVVGFLERQFHITVADEELLPENFQSITSLVAFVQSKLDGSPVWHSEG